MKITKPTFIIDEKQCRMNIEKINHKVQQHSLTFRPHFKTHQSADVGRFFSDFGVDKITVSSVSMAKYFMEHGWQNITIAFPVNVLEFATINEIAEKITLNLLIANESAIDLLDRYLNTDVNIFIEIDTGDLRSGVASDNVQLISKLIEKIKMTSHMRFIGFLSHAGHTYNAKSIEEIHSIHNETVAKMNQLKTHFSEHNPIISIGDTPSCSLSDNFAGIDEIRPGNFVYYDLTQAHLGSCNESEISVILAAPLVDIHKERNEIVVLGGGVHLSKERIQIGSDTIYGKIVLLNDYNWSESLDGCYVKKLSQEHGILHVNDEFIDQFNVGDVIGILPVHSCMTANLMKENTLII